MSSASASASASSVTGAGAAAAAAAPLRMAVAGADVTLFADVAAGSAPSPSTADAEAALFAPFLTAPLEALAGLGSMADADADDREVVAGTARRDPAPAGTSIVIPASSSARSTAFIRGIGTSACSQAARTTAASTLPRVAPKRRRSCRAGWANSEGKGREVGTDDTDNLSSHCRAGGPAAVATVAPAGGGMR